MTPLVSLDNVSVSFGGVHALRNTSLHVAPNEIHALIGPNGAGKSTLVNCITGYQKPSAGRIEVTGIATTGFRPARVAKLGVSRTFQTPQLFNRLSLKDNLRVGPTALGDAALDDLLRHMGLEQSRGVAPEELAYGQQRLLECARALAAGARLLLLDEPAAGLTQQDQEILVLAIRSFVARGDNAVLIIEHNVSLVRSLATRISVLHHGEMIACGAPDVVLTDPVVIEAYLGNDMGGEQH